jgi:hypothetical protein
MSGAIVQSGPIIPGRVPVFVDNGVVQDSGPASGGAIGQIGIQNDGGLAIGINSGPADGPFVQLGMTVDADGAVTFSVNGFNGAPTTELLFNINGVTYAFNPSLVGNITGPNSSTNGDLLSFNGTGGNLAEDSGISASLVTALLAKNLVVAPGTVVSGDLLAFNGAGGALVEDTGIPFGRVIQGPGTVVSGDLPAFSGTPGNAVVDSGVKASALIPQISSISSLRSATTTSLPNPVAYVIGYATGADGGESTFWHNSSDTTSADNGGTIIVDASGRRWYRETGDNCFLIEWFGGRGDGTTDNLAAWTAMAAVLSVQLNGAAIVFRSGGKYLFSSNTTFTYPAGRVYELEIDGPGAILYWPNANGGMVFNASMPSHNLLLHGMHITTGQAAGGYGIYLSQSHPLQSFFNSSFRDVVWRGDDTTTGSGSFGWTIAANVSNWSGTLWEGCSFYSNGSGTLLEFSGTGAGGTGGTNYSIFHNITGCIFQTAQYCLVYGTFAQGVTVSQSNFQNADYAIYVPAGAEGLAQLQVVNNQLSCNIAQVLISVAIPLVMIANNWITGVADQAAVNFTQASGAAVVGNCFTLMGSNTIAIACATDVGSAPFPIAITGNAINGAFVGVQLPTTGENILVSGNSFAFCTNPVVDLSSGEFNRIEGNYGVLPSLSTPTPGSSPWTYSVGSRPQNLTIAATTNISSITLAGSATSLLPAIVPANTPFTLPLEAGMIVVITYSGTLNATAMLL